MNSEHEYERDDLIDLGAVIEETKGTPGVPEDHQGGLIMFAGLSDE